MADLLADEGLTVPEWGPRWRNRVTAAVPPFGSSRNPVDVTATLISHPEILDASLAIAIDHPDTDVVAVLRSARPMEPRWTRRTSDQKHSRQR